MIFCVLFYVCFCCLGYVYVGKWLCSFWCVCLSLICERSVCACAACDLCVWCGCRARM